jgi:hypothetical protein
MNRVRILTALTALIVVLAGSQWCWAESISLAQEFAGSEEGR